MPTGTYRCEPGKLGEMLDRMQSEGAFTAAADTYPDGSPKEPSSAAKIAANNVEIAELTAELAKRRAASANIHADEISKAQAPRPHDTIAWREQLAKSQEKTLHALAQQIAVRDNVDIGTATKIAIKENPVLYSLIMNKHVPGPNPAEAQLNAIAREIMARDKCDLGTASLRAMRQRPDLYEISISISRG